MTTRRTRSLAAGLAASLLLAGAAQAVQDCELNGESVSPYNGNTTAGKTGTMRCKERDTGQLVREQGIQNGKFMGLVRRYEKGQLVHEHTDNERGNRQGRARDFAPDGQLLRESHYDNGSEAGLSLSYHPGGALRRATFYAPPAGEVAYAEFSARGQLTGLRCGAKALLAPAADDARWCGFGGQASQVETFTSQGVVSARSSYLNGQRVRHDTVNAQGLPSYQDEVTPTQRTERYFSPPGTKRRELLWLGAGRDARKVREQEFSDSGTLVRDRRWANGQPQSDEVFYLNGQLRSQARFSGEGEAAVVDSTDYYDSGKLSATGRYSVGGRRQLPVGTFKRFNEAGKLIAQAVYDDKGRITRETLWDDSGQLVRDDAVFEDGSRKAFAR